MNQTIAPKDATPQSRDGTQAGPLMVRHVIDGREVLLPADAELHPKVAKLEDGMKRPLGGTWK